MVSPPVRIDPREDLTPELLDPEAATIIVVARQQQQRFFNTSTAHEYIV